MTGVVADSGVWCPFWPVRALTWLDDGCEPQLLWHLFALNSRAFAPPDLSHAPRLEVGSDGHGTVYLPDAGIKWNADRLEIRVPSLGHRARALLEPRAVARVLATHFLHLEGMTVRDAAHIVHGFPGLGPIPGFGPQEEGWRTEYSRYWRRLGELYGSLRPRKQAA